MVHLSQACVHGMWSGSMNEGGQQEEEERE